MVTGTKRWLTQTAVCDEGDRCSKSLRPHPKSTTIASASLTHKLHAGYSITRN